jgi:NADH-quinone oxidoreductase subunit A
LGKGGHGVSATSESVLFVLGLGIAATAFILLVWGVNAVFSPRNPSQAKGEPYECGVDAGGRPWERVDLRFSTLALLFVLFDAEAALLFAVSTNLHGSLVGVLEVAAFTGFLALGLFYAWRKGALKWLS